MSPADLVPGLATVIGLGSIAILSALFPSSSLGFMSGGGCLERGRPCHTRESGAAIMDKTEKIDR